MGFSQFRVEFMQHDITDPLKGSIRDGRSTAIENRLIERVFLPEKREDRRITIRPVCSTRGVNHHHHHHPLSACIFF
jgi:hypothetical protein